MYQHFRRGDFKMEKIWGSTDPNQPSIVGIRPPQIHAKSLAASSATLKSSVYADGKLVIAGRIRKWVFFGGASDTETPLTVGAANFPECHHVLLLKAQKLDAYQRSTENVFLRQPSLKGT